ncbi:MAG: hypothetical protein K1W16_03530 [Lachnospiraceae bacterium]|jgi:DnaJ domain.
MNLREFKSVTDIESFKELGTLSDIIKKLNEIVTPLVIEADTYEALYEEFLCLKEKWRDFMEGPFVDKRAEYTFYLTKLEGKQRNKMLGITDEMYDSPELAKQWYRNIVKLVHPDIAPSNDKAFNVLQQLYEVMLDNNEDDNDER